LIGYSFTLTGDGISAGIISKTKLSFCLIGYSFALTGESDFTLYSELEDSPSSSSSSEDDSPLSS